IILSFPGGRSPSGESTSQRARAAGSSTPRRGSPALARARRVMTALDLAVLQQTHRPQAAIRADADDGFGSHRHRRKFFHGLTQDACASSTKGVTERDAAAMRVHAL